MDEIKNDLFNLKVYLITKTFPQSAYEGEGKEKKSFVNLLYYMGLTTAVNLYRIGLGRKFIANKNLNKKMLEFIISERAFDFGGILIKFDNISDLAWCISNIDYVMQNDEFEESITSYCDFNKVEWSFNSNGYERLVFIYMILNMRDDEIDEICDNLSNKKESIPLLPNIEKEMISKIKDDPIFELFRMIYEDIKTKTLKS